MGSPTGESLGLSVVVLNPRQVKCRVLLVGLIVERNRRLRPAHRDVDAGAIHVDLDGPTDEPGVVRRELRHRVGGVNSLGRQLRFFLPTVVGRPHDAKTATLRSARLLHHVGQFMGQQLATRAGVRLKPTGGKHDVPADRKGTGLNLLGQRGLLVAAMDENRPQIPAEARLHRGAKRIIQRHAAA